MAMSESRGRAIRSPRWANLVLGRLPLLLVLCAFVLMPMNYSVKAQNEPGPPDHGFEETDVTLELSSCDDLKDERTEVFGVVAVNGPIICTENRILRVKRTFGPYSEVAFVSHSPIIMEGVQFEVPPDTSMLFGAPTLNFEKGKDSSQAMFSVHGILALYTDSPLPVPEGGTKDDLHSMIRKGKAGKLEVDGIVHYTGSGLTVASGIVAPEPINQESKWAQRPRHEKHARYALPPFSIFTPPRTTRESFEERLVKSPRYLNVGEEIHWPSSMSSEDGTVLTLGGDGSLLLKKRAAAAADAAAAAAAAAAEAGSDSVVQPPVTLLAADVRKANRALEELLTRGGGKAVEFDLSGRKGCLNVPGAAGGGAAGRTVLSVTDVGDVEVTIDGKKVLHKTAPHNKRTWRKKFFDRVKRRKVPKGDYQMHLVSDGFEVRLDGATIWGVHSADLPPVAC